jgi:hypothetical protein
VAKVLTRGDQYALSFRGTDGLTDPWDWYYNIKGVFFTGPHGTLHGGFYEYQQVLSDCINRNVESGKKFSYIFGHSLGGAAAVAYYHSHPDMVDSDTQVITFGAPKAHTTGGCGMKGYRYLDANDPIGGSLLGAMDSYSHMSESQEKTKIYRDVSSRRRWWSSSPPEQFQWEEADCNEPSSDYSEWYGYNLPAIIYHFATTHVDSYWENA